MKRLSSEDLPVPYGRFSRTTDNNANSKGLFCIRTQQDEVFASPRDEKHLEEARRSAIKKVAGHGFTAGAAWCLICCTYPLGIYRVVLHANAKVMRTFVLGFWYGTKLVRDGEYIIGAVNMVSARRLDREMKIASW